MHQVLLAVMLVVVMMAMPLCVLMRTQDRVPMAPPAHCREATGHSDTHSTQCHSVTVASAWGSAQLQAMLLLLSLSPPPPGGEDGAADMQQPWWGGLALCREH